MHWFVRQLRGERGHSSTVEVVVNAESGDIELVTWYWVGETAFLEANQRHR